MVILELLLAQMMDANEIPEANVYDSIRPKYANVEVASNDDFSKDVKDLDECLNNFGNSLENFAEAIKMKNLENKAIKQVKEKTIDYAIEKELTNHPVNQKLEKDGYEYKMKYYDIKSKVNMFFGSYQKYILRLIKYEQRTSKDNWIENASNRVAETFYYYHENLIDDHIDIKTIKKLIDIIEYEQPKPIKKEKTIEPKKEPIIEKDKDTSIENNYDDNVLTIEF